MPNDVIRYDLRVQEALRGMVRNVLVETVKDGLPGNHHFYITFKTAVPGVRISGALREKYPGDMTIVLQHHFWDLKVSDQGFEVGLSFANIPEKLVVPFAAVVGFWDPSVNFILQFEPDLSVPAAEADGPEPKAAGPMPVAALRGKASEPKESAPVRAEKSPAPKSEEATVPKSDEPAGEPAVKVVSLDSFRRKS